MWCVFATGAGREELIQQMCKRHLNNKVYSRCMFGKPYTVVVGLEIPQKTAQEENSSSNTSLKARTDRTSAGVFHKKRKNYRKKGNAKERHSYRNFTSKSC